MLEEKFTEKEVKTALWSINGDKSPGPDGYRSKFFKDSWEVVGKYVVDAIMEFFRTKEMLKVLNHTVITIIPKSSYATSVGDYRPIAGCNTIYKVISKMLCNKLRVILPTLISANQECIHSRKNNSAKCSDMSRSDEILLFCKGNYQSAMLMLRGLQSFTNSSGLTTNAGKFNIFSANMPKQELEDLCEETGYQKGALPFRYLRVPISAKKLSSLDCEILIDKMTARIRAWSSRNLSYAGRVQLINSVLLHEQTNKAPLIAWDIVCRPKSKGGLGVMDCLIWNGAAIVKYV
ncbi:uncharacterized protein LOC142164316 [Nicotiana tabacum]|uniref:Uncharacterized protein LOC142164316 n=1 Tax=Nicotiana tabacum TaxID=4097 RepID=A0AC58S087_TOBAC